VVKLTRSVRRSSGFVQVGIPDKWHDTGYFWEAPRVVELSLLEQNSDRLIARVVADSSNLR